MSYLTTNRKPLTYQLQLRRGIDTVAALTGTLQLTDKSSNFLRLDPGAANRELRMPASNRDGVVFWITHVGAANNLLLKDSAGVDIQGVTVVLTPGQATMVVSEGGTWRHMGIQTIVL